MAHYIKGNPGQGLFFPSNNLIYSLMAYCDSDCASCPFTRKSSGYCVRFDNATISWKFNKQETISRSSVKAEYRSMGITVAEIIWLRGLLKELGVSFAGAVVFHCDNKAAI